MTSLRELILCATSLTGSHTVREHLAATECLSLGGEIVINGEIVVIQEEDSIMLSEVINEVEVIEADIISIDDALIPETIDEISEDTIDGIC